MNTNIIKQKHFKPINFNLQHVDLCFYLNPIKTHVINTMLFKNVIGDILLNGIGIELISISLNGKTLKPIEYIHDNYKIIIPKAPKKSTIKIISNINPSVNSRLEGLYISDKIFVTQCEAQGFRRITYFPDRPDVLSTYTVKITGNKNQYPVILSNGNLVSKKCIKNDLEVVWNDPFKKPSYLFALVAGKLSQTNRKFVTKSKNKVDLNIWIRKEDKNKINFALDCLEQAMKWDEKKYNLEYDLNIFNIAAINNFNMGAMENKSLNIFNSKYLISDKNTSTDNEYDFIETIVAHEYFHNWTGNRITCRDWFQLSLKEGLTVYRDQEFSSDMGSRAVKRIKDVRMLRAIQFAEDAGPLAHSVRPESYAEINNFYTATVYNKGAELIRMLENILTPKGFLKGFKYYIKKYDGKAAICENFIHSMETTNNIDLRQFYLWYSQAGTPEINIIPDYNIKNKKLSIKVTQNVPDTPKQKNKKAMLIPLKISLFNAEGKKYFLDKNKSKKELTILLKNKSHTFYYENIEANPAISINRGFTSPVKINLEQDKNKLQILMMHDNDSFKKWDQIYKYLLDLCIKQSKTTKNVKIDLFFIKVIKEILLNAEKDPAFASELLSLPSESEISENIKKYNPEKVFSARKEIIKTIKNNLSNEFHLIYKKCLNKTNLAARGWRALHNTCLQYLTIEDNLDAQKLVLEAYKSSNNMTIKLYSLSCISNMKSKDRNTILLDFYEKYKKQPIMIEKWFQVQASAKLKNNLRNIKRLVKSSEFTYKNPNQVRSLLNVFAKNNPINFHDNSGKGYKFIADQIIILDSINPSSAASLSSAFSNWKSLDQNRKKIIKINMKRILQKKNLSPNTFEIINNINKS